MKKILLSILLSSGGMSEAVRKRIPSVEILVLRFQERKLEYFIKTTEIIEKFANQEVESDSVTQRVNELLDKSDQAPVAHLMEIFEVTPLLIEAILKDSPEINEN